MKKTLRTVALILLVTFTSLMLFGCGDTGKSEVSSEPSPTSTQPKEKAKLKFWVISNNPILQDLVSEYNKNNKDNVEIEYSPQVGKYEDVLNLSFVAGQSPDIFMPSNVDFFRGLVEKGYLEDLTPYITPEIKNRYIEGSFANNFNVFNGKYYSMPAVMGVRKLLYNADLFTKAGLDPEKPPKTMQDLKEYANKITAAGGGKSYGFAIAIGVPGTFAANGFQLPGTRSFGVSNGFDFSKGVFDFSEYKPIVETYRQMLTEKTMFPGSATLKDEQLAAQFAAGNIGMAVFASGWAPRFGNDDLKYDFKMKSADMPYAGDKPISKYFMNIQTGYSISAASKYKKEAFRFTEWLGMEEAAGTLAAAGSDFSQNKAVLGNPKYEAKGEVAKLFTPTSNYGIFPPIPGGLVVEGDNFQKIFVNLVIGNMDIVKELKGLSDRYNKALEKSYTDGINKKEDFIFKDFYLLK